MSRIAMRDVAVALALSASVPAALGAQRRVSDGRFTGVLIGIEVSRQSIIGGALVGGVDVLAQAVRPVVSLTVGARYELPTGTVVGAELGRGVFDGRLQQDGPNGAYHVDYRGGRQSHWALTLGQVVGGREGQLVSAYVSEVSRDFDVRIIEGTRRYPQRDGQGLLRFGVMGEHASGPIRMRVGIGSSRADFGDATTNIRPRRPLELSLSLGASIP